MGARVTYPSVEAMLEPTELAGLLARPVDSVALAPMTTVGSSSTESDFRGVFVDGEATPAAVLKIARWSAAVTTMMANAWALGEDSYDPRRDPPWDSIHWWVARAERGLRLIGAA